MCRAAPSFEVSMSDVWVWDVFRSNRFVKKVHAYSVRDVNVERTPAQPGVHRAGNAGL